MNYLLGTIALIAVIALAWSHINQGSYRQSNSYMGSKINNELENNQINSKIVHQDTNYGYQLALNKQWEGYITTSAKDKEMLRGNSGITFFCVPTSDPNWTVSGGCGKGYYDIFAITAWTPAQWAALADQRADGGPGYTLIGKNDKYYFTYSHAQDAPSDALNKNYDETSIFETFKAL